MLEVHDGAIEVPVAFRLGEWSVDPMLNRISRDGHSIQLRPRAMDVLVFLARQPGDVATKEQLIDSVWRTEFVTENALTHVISELRTELGDDAKNPSYIENIPRRGYRLIAEVSALESPEPRLAQVVQLPTAVGTVRPDDEFNPYPGLAPFTEKDATFFFGRETEVARMWRTLTSRRLLGLIGPSGVGKSSFLRAGVMSSAPDGWGVLICQPGESPFVSLARTLVPEFAGDVEATKGLFDIRDGRRALPTVSRWRERHERALLIVDQFEELFTLNPIATQEIFIDLLGSLVDEADLHVLLSMRDDFLHRCHTHAPLRTIFDHLTALEKPDAESLRRALVEPAGRLGFSLEEDQMAAEMITEVEDERGALPLLAFSVAELWDRRDRERRLLTRRAYEAIGGVTGSLARHAEKTLESLGPERLPIVRELFRNLVTAENTRAVRCHSDLMSVFPNELRESGGEVIRRLIDARLLTTYEDDEDGSETARRIEIIHESLLSNWPRLIRWRSQDADAARFRDELRQAARTWHERGRNNDLLWTGSAFREFQVWRDHYPGGLTEVEEAFETAMTTLAARRQRRRRVAATAAFVTLLVVLFVVGGLWRQSVRETRRAEAAKLLALGQVSLAEERTTAVAYAIASLELADTAEARRLALRALWMGPPATVVFDRRQCWWIAFAPDGGRMAVGDNLGLLRVHSRRPGPLTKLNDFWQRGMAVFHEFSPDSRLLVGWASDAGPEFRIWDVESGQTVRIIEVPNVSLAGGIFDGDGQTILSTGFQDSGPLTNGAERFGRYFFHRWSLDGGEPELLGSVEATMSPKAEIDVSRKLLVVGNRDTLYLHRLESLGRDPPKIVGRYPEAFGLNSKTAFDPVKDRIAASDSGGNLLLWPIDGDGSQPERRLQAPRDPMATTFGPEGRFLAHSSRKGVRLWDLEGPVGAAGLIFDWGAHHVAFTPDRHWLATASYRLGLALWPLTSPYCRILHGHQAGVPRLAFSPDGSHLFSQGSDDGTVLSWDLGGGAGLEPTVVFQVTPQWGWGLEVDRRGRFLVVGTPGGIWKVPLDGDEPVKLEGFPRQNSKLDPSGRYLAGRVFADHGTEEMHVLDLETGNIRVFETPGEGNVRAWNFDSNGKLIVARGGVISRWSPETGLAEVLIAEEAWGIQMGPDGLHMLCWIDGAPTIFDLEDGTRTRIDLPEGDSDLGPGPSGPIVMTRTGTGEFFVGPVGGVDRHLLLGHTSSIPQVKSSPDGRWIASGDWDGTIRLWPMPDFSKPPLHTLPHDELMVTLERLTNLRVVPDNEASTGYRVEADLDAYRGWQKTPEW